MSFNDAACIRALLAGNEPDGSRPTRREIVELANRLTDVPLAERAGVFSEWISSADGYGEELMVEMVGLQRGNSASASSPPKGIWRLDSLLTHRFARVPVLVGEPDNALIIAKAGHLVVGQSGVGKTYFVFDMALRLAAGGRFLGYQIVRPLNSLILQAELPIEFAQQRFNQMVMNQDHCSDTAGREFIRRVNIMELPERADLKNPGFIEELARAVEGVSADVVILDPFLPFFGGDENSNHDVREVLDELKNKIAGRYDCAIFVVDHLPKSDYGRGPKVRGAGAKIDWASMVINLSRDASSRARGEHYLYAEVTKVRHAPQPSEAFHLRFDPRTMRLSVDTPVEEDPRRCTPEGVREIILENGGEVSSQRELLPMIRERFGVGARIGRKAIEDAVSNDLIVEVKGPHNSTRYRANGGSNGNSGNQGERTEQ